LESINKDIFMQHLKLFLLFLVITVSPNFLRAESAYPSYSVDWSPNDQWIATANGDNRVRIWNATTGLVEQSIYIKQPTRIQDEVYAPADVEWSPASDKFAFIIRTMSDASLIGVIDLLQNNGYSELDNNGELLDVLTDIEWSSDGTRIAGANHRGRGSFGDYHVKVWNISSGMLTQEIRTKTGVNRLTWNPDLLQEQITMTSALEALVWHLDSDRLDELEGHEGNVTSATYNADGTQLATRDSITIQIWDAKSLVNLKQMSIGTDAPIDKITWAANGEFVTQGIHEIYRVDSSGARISDSNIPLSNNYFDLDSTGERVVVSADSESIVIYDLNGKVIPFTAPTPSATPTTSQ
jgi:WD40 repeat protein